MEHNILYAMGKKGASNLVSLLSTSLEPVVDMHKYDCVICSCGLTISDIINMFSFQAVERIGGNIYKQRMYGYLVTPLDQTDAGRTIKNEIQQIKNDMNKVIPIHIKGNDICIINCACDIIYSTCAFVRNPEENGRVGQKS